MSEKGAGPCHLDQRFLNSSNQHVRPTSKTCRRTVDIGSVDGLPAEWLHSTWVYRNICSPNGGQHPSGIDGCMLKGSIAMDCADAQKTQIRMVCGEEDSESILCFGSASQEPDLREGTDVMP